MTWKDYRQMSGQEGGHPGLGPEFLGALTTLSVFSEFVFSLISG